MSDELDDVAEPVLPADEVAEIRKWIKWNGYVDAGRLADSHESLRVTVARLHTAADDLVEHLGNRGRPACIGCGLVSARDWHADGCPLAALRAALDASSILAPPGTVVAVVTRPDTQEER